jgi:hypothetical protein
VNERKHAASQVRERERERERHTHTHTHTHSLLRETKEVQQKWSWRKHSALKKLPEEHSKQAAAKALSLAYSVTRTSPPPRPVRYYSSSIRSLSFKNLSNSTSFMLKEVAALQALLSTVRRSDLVGTREEKEAWKNWLAEIGRVWKVGRRKEGIPVRARREEKRRKKEGKEVVATHNNRWSECCVEATRQSDRSIGRSITASSYVSGRGLSDRPIPPDNSEFADGNPATKWPSPTTYLIGGTKPSRPRRVLGARAGSRFWITKRDCCRGWGAGQARATDWTEVENYLRVNAASLGRFSGSSVSAVCSLCRLAGQNPAAFWQYLLYVLRSLPPPRSPYYNLLLPTLFSWF